MGEFSATGEARVLTNLVESRLDPHQSTDEKAVEENAIQRELDGMTSLQLQHAISAFNHVNTGMFKFNNWTEIEAKEVHANGGVYNSPELECIKTDKKIDLFNSPITGVKFIPRGYLYDTAESFSVNLSRTPGYWLTEPGRRSELFKREVHKGR